MRVTNRWILTGLLPAILLGLAPAVLFAEAALNQRINLDLKGAAPKDVMESCAALIGGEVLIEPGIEGEVTMTFQHVRVETFLNALCESIGCAWTLEEGEPNVLRFSPVPALDGEEREGGGLDMKINMSLAGAAAADVLSSFASILEAEAVLDLELGDSEITIELSEETVAAAIDRVCEQLGCRWSVERNSTGRILRFEPAD